MTDDTTREGAWNRSEYVGEGQRPDEQPDDATEAATAAADATTGERWTKTQWPGDQGEGTRRPQDPDAMPEGETGLSGDRQTSGEGHFARGQAEDERNA